jgi:quinol monooxygenase YgiN
MKATYGFRATMTAHLGKGDALVALLLDATRGEGPATNPACVFFVVTRSLAERDVVHVTEGWTSKEAHAENFGREASRAFTAELAPLIAGAQYGDDVPVGGKFGL